MKIRRLAFLLVSLFILASNAIPLSAQQTKNEPLFPNVPASPNSAIGEALEMLESDIEQGMMGNLDEVRLIYQDTLIFHRKYTHNYQKIMKDQDDADHLYNYHQVKYHPFYQKSGLHTLQSISKSITALTFGAAIANGHNIPLDAPVLSFFEDRDIQHIDNHKKNLTIFDLLSMRHGIDWDEHTRPYTDPENNCAVMENSSDWVQYVLDLPMAKAPNTEFVYNSGATVVLAAIFTKITGKVLDEYANEHLFKPIGIKEYYWKRTPKNITDAEGGCYLKNEDLARIGYLLLKDGNWKGKQLIDSNFLEKMTTLHTTFPGRGNYQQGYGFQLGIFLNKEGELQTLSHSGYGGQWLIVDKANQAILVANSWNIIPEQQPGSSVNFAYFRDIRSVLKAAQKK